MAITVQHPSDDDIATMKTWPTWNKEISVFDWHYDVPETCYLVEGEVTVTTPDGQVVSFGPGDRVTFPAGLTYTWAVRKPVRKHFRLG
jgi:hypothetical protein